MRAEGIAIAAELCEELLAGGAPGLHFYTLNRSKATLEIFAALQHHRLTSARYGSTGMRTVTVTGHGSAAAVPDTAVVRVSAVHRARRRRGPGRCRVRTRAAVVTAARRPGRSRPSTSRCGPTNEQGEQPGFEARHSLTIATRRPGDRRRAPLRAGLRGRRPAAGRGRLARGAATRPPRSRRRARRVRRRARQGGPPRRARRRDARRGRGGRRGRWLAGRCQPGGFAAMAKADVGAAARRDAAISSSLTVTWSARCSSGRPDHLGDQRGGQPDERQPAPGVACAPAAYTPSIGVARPEPVPHRAAALPQHAVRRAAPLLDQVARACGRPG